MGRWGGGGDGGGSSEEVCVCVHVGKRGSLVNEHADSYLHL